MRIALTVLGVSLGLMTVLLSNVPSAADEPKQEWGTIKGQIVWGEKDLPAVVKLNIDQDPLVCKKNGDIVSEEYVVDPKTKGVKNVFVWLAAATPPKKGAKWAAIPIHPALAKSKDKTVTLDQPCCSFEPHVLAMRDDQTLEVKNSASVPHNIHFIGEKVNDNKIMPPNTSLTELVAASATPVNVQCDIHRWMKGYVRVFDHPYFQVTAVDGKFEIKNVPAGEYRILIWHEGMGWVTFDNPEKGKEGKLIKIKANGDTDLGTFKLTKSKDD